MFLFVTLTWNETSLNTVFVVAVNMAVGVNNIKFEIVKLKK